MDEDEVDRAARGADNQSPAPHPPKDDEGSSEASGSGEKTCPECDGTGRKDGDQCPICEGTGKVKASAAGE